jgi:prepilin-type N-terminal cleavage/methylation domain-containing protein
MRSRSAGFTLIELLVVMRALAGAAISFGNGKVDLEGIQKRYQPRFRSVRVRGRRAPAAAVVR